jgi:hypothetical protein
MLCASRPPINPKEKKEKKRKCLFDFMNEWMQGFCKKNVLIVSEK